MIKTNNCKDIVEYLNILFPEPKCELNYSKDYEFLLVVMLSAQTTDKSVNKVSKVLFNKYKTLDELANASINDIINIIKPIGTYNKKAFNIKQISRKLIEESSHIVPNNRTFLESLDGVGRKTTNVVLGELYDEPYFAVDTHVSRVSKRLGIAKDFDNTLIIEKKLLKYFKGYKPNILHYQFVLFGRYLCKAINPKCSECKLNNICKKKSN